MRRVFAAGVFTQNTAHVLRVVVDEGSSLEVRVEKIVQGVLLGQLAVHGDQDSFQDNVGVTEVGDNLVNAVVRGAENREAAGQDKYALRRVDERQTSFTSSFSSSSPSSFFVS